MLICDYIDPICHKDDKQLFASPLSGHGVTPDWCGFNVHLLKHKA